MNIKNTLVTGFFPIGRGEWEGYQSRSDEKYLKYFSHWAIIQNDLIIFAPKNIAEKALQIRKNYGRNNTIIKIIDDVDSLNAPLLKRMLDVAPRYAKFSIMPWCPEIATPKYDYAVSLKFWAMHEAAKIVKTPYMSWIDFGFDHGGECYKDQNELDMEWSYLFKKDVTIFAVKKPNDDPVIDIIRRLDTYIQSNIFVVKTNYSDDFYRQNMSQYDHLLSCDIIDDDQIILHMSARQNPEHYEILPTSWFSMIRDYSGDQPVSKTIAYGSDEVQQTGKQRRWWHKILAKHFIKQYLYYSKKKNPMVV